MNEKIKSAFDSVYATEELKDRTREFLAKRTGGYQKKRASVPVYRRLALAACVLLLLLWGGWYLYFTPVASISVDVNPSIELGINRFDRVISVVGYNEDGRALADSLRVRFLPYEEALDRILSGDSFAQYMAPEQFVSVTVIGESEEKSGEMLERVTSCAGHHENVHCSSGNYEEAGAAHKAGLSFGKYRAFLELQALDPTVTPEDVQGLTMRQIRDRIAALSGGAGTVGEESAAPGEQQSGPASDECRSDPVSSCADSHAQADNRGTGNCLGSGNGKGSGKGNGQGKGHHGKHG